MKKLSILFILSTIIVASLAAQQNTVSSIKLNSALDSACYAIGVNYGTGLRDYMQDFPGGTANFYALAEAFSRAIIGDLETLLLKPEEAQVYINSYIMELSIKEEEAAIEEEMRFFAENRTKEGVITTESGLQYKVLKQGEGDKPTAEDIVTVNYTGKLLDGSVFDSSEAHGEPATFVVAQVIAGWIEVLQLMPLGSKYVVWVPSELAYGSQGAGNVIKPNSTLEFEIELLGIEVSNAGSLNIQE